MTQSERESIVKTPAEQATVLDWFKSLLRLRPIPIPEPEDADSELGPFRPRPAAAPIEAPPRAPWSIQELTAAKVRLPAAILVAFAAQLALERRAGIVGISIALYAVAGLLFLWGFLSGDFTPEAIPATARREFGLKVRTRPLLGALVLALLTFLASGGNRFRLTTVVAWGGATLLLLIGLWEGEIRVRDRLVAAVDWLGKPRLRVHLEPWHLLVMAAVFLVALFRFSSLATVPYEMWSDHAEKLLDVQDVLRGDTSIFFPRNSGREAIQFYLVAFAIRVFGAGLSFLTLKAVTATAGFAAVLFLYGFAKEIGGKRVALLALLLAGMAFWPNITSRAGVRAPLNELAVAPALFFMLRGLRTRRRNQFLWAGLAVGLGLQGYSGARALPLAVLVGFAIYLIHERTRERRLQGLAALSVLGMVAFIAFLPLLRVLVDMPDQVLYRVLTRAGTLEQPYESSPILIFLRNMWDVLTMFAWDTGQIWVMTVPKRPALDWITGGLFHLGLVLTLALYWRTRRWQYLFLLLVIPVLLLTSAFALAFPNENPAPARVSGAIVPVFTIAALGMDSVYIWLREHLAQRIRVVAPVLLVLLFSGIALGNFRLVVDTYAARQRASAWNATEAGEVMRGFGRSIGHFEDVYLVHTPYWMDSRLIAIEAGAPIRDYGILPEGLDDLELASDRYHLFFMKPEDTASVDLLMQIHPDGELSHYQSDVEGRDFLVYLVPPKAATTLRPPVDERP